ncbi:NUDIX hydrolase [Gloeothece citriformis PCC 7424]|uniref:NUDIX hydrolase n=1 Tax=Gloeothece citriformis (strain PCC 7424) TaxID=65393 RepID=B7KGP7_GLOC7|nr:NUDIX hydrolase [Gloeothece citriformis]ACK71974.1 NUDIX hydrolase [Gloeothece citriformis PCC 7424]
MTQIKKWTSINSQLILNNKWCKVKQDCVKLPNGLIVDDYFVNLRPEIALVLPITPEQNIVFVRQYRHGVEEILLELPAGSFEAQEEDSLTAARRELEEETGYIAQHFIKLATLYDNPVKDSNKIHLYLALDATPTGKQHLDLTEDIEVILIPMTAIKQKITEGEISVSGTVAALYLGLDYINYPTT